MAGIGWIYLHIRYRSKDKVRQILKEHYADSYHAAGSVYILHFIGFMMILCFILGFVNAMLMD